MADPLLTSLCSICHISDPKYKCPRCSIRTCSLSCIKKHKAWASCSGVRDPTVYRRKKDLHTASGVDHDYNFIHGIETSIERSEKELVEEKALVQRDELRPPTIKEVKWRPGRDGRKRKVVVTRLLREPTTRSFEKLLAGALKKFNVKVICAPTGMQRQKDNATTYNRRSGRINWQVEWLAFGGCQGEVKRTLHKVMDDVPLFKAYPAVLEQDAKNAGQAKVKPARLGRHTAQVYPDATWVVTMDCMQEPATHTWAVFESDADLWPAEREQERMTQYGFYLARHGTRSDEDKVLTALDPQQSLRSILADTSVIEFPTIYVLRAGDKLPPGFALGPKNTISKPQRPGDKRRTTESSGDKSSLGARSAKKRRTKGGGAVADEGEVGERGEASEGEDGDSEQGEVIDEQSWDEEDGDDTSDTSSSGTDSDEDE